LPLFILSCSSPTSHVLRFFPTRRSSDLHVIYASSSSVYGANPALPKNEYDWTRPLSPYAVSKLGGESYVLAYQESYTLPSIAYRDRKSTRLNSSHVSNSYDVFCLKKKKT